MIRALAIALAAGLLATSSAVAQKGPAMPAPIVFFDIAGPDSAAQAKFYAAVFDWKVGPGASLGVPVQAGGALNGILRTDPAEKVIYLGVDDISATLAKVTANGGKVAAPRYVVPGVVIMALFFDPAGNRMGLVEMKDGKPIVP
jgi:predicted enzyme related to lactoylglutathione lyase